MVVKKATKYYQDKKGVMKEKTKKKYRNLSEKKNKTSKIDTTK